MRKLGKLIGIAAALAALAAGPGAGHWPAGRAVVIADEVVHTVKPGGGRVRDWRELRDRVLAAYAPSGIVFTVVERAPGACGLGAMRDGEILLCRGARSEGFPGETYGHITRGLASIQYPRVRAGVCHEIGHALGLGHTGRGCMAYSSSGFVVAADPAPEDLQALHAARDHSE